MGLASKLSLNEDFLELFAHSSESILLDPPSETSQNPSINEGDNASGNRIREYLFND